MKADCQAAQAGSCLELLWKVPFWMGIALAILLIEAWEGLRRRQVWLGSFVLWLGFFVMWLGRRLRSGNVVACQPLFGLAKVFRHTIRKDLTGTNSPLGQGKPLVVAWLILWLAWGGVNWHSVEVRQSNSSCYKERLYWVNTPLARGRSLKV